jgi:hypothetical protein
VSPSCPRTSRSGRMKSIRTAVEDRIFPISWLCRSVVEADAVAVDSCFQRIGHLSIKGSAVIGTASTVMDLIGRSSTQILAKAARYSETCSR